MPVLSKEMIATYIQRRKSDRERLQTALVTRDFESFKRIGHQIKGNAATFGFHELSAIATALEEAGRDHDASLAEQTLGVFASWINGRGC